MQYLMGHADIATTLNIYTHLKLEDAKDELEQLKIREKLKKVGIGRDGRCQERIKESERSLKVVGRKGEKYKWGILLPFVLLFTTTI